MKSASRLLAAALLTGLAFRLVLLLIPTAPLATKVLEPTGDSPEYVRLATNLVHGHGFSQDSVPPFRPDILRTPVYPLFLALPLIVHRPSFVVVAVALQILLSLAVLWLTYRLGIELGLTPETAALASFLSALSPNLAFYSVKLTTEMLFLPLLLVTLLLINRFRILHRRQELFAAGICSGLLILTRPIAIFFPVVLAAYVFWLARRSPFTAHRPSLVVPLVFLACVSIVVAPWVIRNRRVAGRYTISTVFDYDIYEYSGALTLAAARLIPVEDARDSLAAEAEHRFGPLDENDQVAYWSAMARVGRQQMFARPLLAAKVHVVGSAGGLMQPVGIRPLLVFSGVDPTAGDAGTPGVAQKTLQLVARGRVGQALALAWKERVARIPGLALVILAYAVLFHTALLVIGAVGLFLRRSRGLLWLLLPILYFVVTAGPVSEVRFRVPIEPLLCIFAAVALTRQPRTSNVGASAPAT
jgi:4-amino-4-deoxy-L-arabinose transferase-like glycosyltransferase